MRTKAKKKRVVEVSGGPDPERQLVYRLQAEMCRALGHPERLAIIDLLEGGEQPTAGLRRRLGIGKVNLSRHLTLLRQVGLVESRSQGREAFYRLAFCEIGSACSSIRQVLALKLRRNAGLASSLAGPMRMEPSARAQRG
jgi:DNA-binding transcriptional ArsR family regulator